MVHYCVLYSCMVALLPLVRVNRFSIHLHINWMQRATVSLPGVQRSYHNRSKDQNTSFLLTFLTTILSFLQNTTCPFFPPFLLPSPVWGLSVVYSSRWEGVWSALWGLFADKQSFEVLLYSLPRQLLETMWSRCPLFWLERGDWPEHGGGRGKRMCAFLGYLHVFGFHSQLAFSWTSSSQRRSNEPTRWDTRVRHAPPEQFKLVF